MRVTVGSMSTDERERGREAVGLLKCSCTDERGVDEQAGDDRRDRAHRVDDDPHRSREPAADLVEEDRGRDAERHRDQHRDADLLERADDRVRRRRLAWPCSSGPTCSGPG